MNDARVYARALQAARQLLSQGLAPHDPDSGVAKALRMAEVRHDLFVGELKTAAKTIQSMARERSNYPWEKLRRGPFKQSIQSMEAGPRSGFELLAKSDARRMEREGIEGFWESDGEYY